MTVCGTIVTLHPDAGAICVVFLFPNGDSKFDLIDDSSAGCKCGVTMGGADCDGDSDFTYLKMADAMLALSC